MASATLPFMPIDIEALRGARERAGLTQDEAAKACGLANKQVWNAIERGRQTSVTLATLDRIAQVLGVRVKDLVK